jgi:hypothetical protein
MESIDISYNRNQNLNVAALPLLLRMSFEIAIYILILFTVCFLRGNRYSAVALHHFPLCSFLFIANKPIVKSKYSDYSFN